MFHCKRPSRKNVAAVFQFFEIFYFLKAEKLPLYILLICLESHPIGRGTKRIVSLRLIKLILFYISSIYF